MQKKQKQKIQKTKKPNKIEKDIDTRIKQMYIFIYTKNK